MKNLIAMTLILLCTGCTTMKEYKQQVNEYATELKTLNDPIQVIEIYKTDFSGIKTDCEALNKNEKVQEEQGFISKAIGGISVAALSVVFFPFIPAVIAVNNEENLKRYECLKKELLKESDVKYECVYKDSENYNSDECVLYRRSPEYHETQVDYFDYKRFLPESSPVKTDEHFLKLVEKYNSIGECDKLNETTTAEKEACKEKIKNEIRLLATRTVKCSELKGKEYTEFLIGRGDWYEYAQNHDPYDNINLLRAVGAYEAAAFAYNPVYSQKEAQKEVQKSIEKYGTENLCSVENWKQDMKKLGYYMK